MWARKLIDVRSHKVIDWKNLFSLLPMSGQCRTRAWVNQIVVLGLDIKVKFWKHRMGSNFVPRQDRELFDRSKNHSLIEERPKSFYTCTYKYIFSSQGFLPAMASFCQRKATIQSSNTQIIGCVLDSRRRVIYIAVWTGLLMINAWQRPHKSLRIFLSLVYGTWP